MPLMCTVTIRIQVQMWVYLEMVCFDLQVITFQIPETVKSRWYHISSITITVRVAHANVGRHEIIKIHVCAGVWKYHNLMKTNPPSSLDVAKGSLLS